MTAIFFSRREESDRFILRSYRKYCELKGLTPKALKVERDRPKPYFSDGPCFSLSHSGEYIVCAMGDSPIGIDIQERKKVDIKGISEKFFGETVTDEREFFDMYTRGEATVKRYEISLPEGMRTREGKNYDFFPGYSLALCGGDTVFFCEI